MSWLPDLMEALGGMVLGVAGVLLLVYCGDAAPRAVRAILRRRR